MTSWRRYQRGNDSDKVIVHITRVSKGSGRSGHDGGNLRRQRILQTNTINAQEHLSGGMKVLGHAVCLQQFSRVRHYPEQPRKCLACEAAS